jgi:cardiolipin synthase
MSTVSQWEFDTSSETAWERMLGACGKAKHTIDMEHFIMGAEGQVIDEFVSVFREKVKVGVRIRMLLDIVGSFSFYHSDLRTELEGIGIEIRFHSTIIPPRLRRFMPFLLRDHRKLLIVDDVEVHVGGVIIEERAREWRDTNVRLVGSIAEDATVLFAAAWEKTDRMKPAGPAVTNDDKTFYLAGNSYDLRHKILYGVMVRGLVSAKRYIHVTTPYFALTRDVRRAIVYAQGNGAEVIFLLPKRSDNFFADVLARFFYPWLLRHRVRIFHYTDGILHTKAIVVDGSWSTVGSCNLDWLSTWLNYELNLVSTDEAFTGDLESQFQEDLRISYEVTPRTKGWYGFF